jgi:hypothetical protein
MKGGKEGRKRKTSASGAGRQHGAPGKAKKGTPKRPTGGAPKKGSRKKTYGAMPTSEDE